LQASLGIRLKAGLLFVDQTIGDEKYVHAELSGHHVLTYIIADHHAVAWLYPPMLENLVIIP
jgi:hypothetical protein